MSATLYCKSIPTDSQKLLQRLLFYGILTLSLRRNLPMFVAYTTFHSLPWSATYVCHILYVTFRAARCTDCKTVILYIYYVCYSGMARSFPSDHACKCNPVESWPIRSKYRCRLHNNHMKCIPQLITFYDLLIDTIIPILRLQVQK